MARRCPRRSAICRARATCRTAFKRMTLLRPEHPERVLVVGLGKPGSWTPERLRVAAALVVSEAAPLRGAVARLGRCPGSRRPSAPKRGPRRVVEGTVLGLVPVRPLQVPRSRRSGAAQARAPGVGRRRASAASDRAGVEAARVASEAANRRARAPGPAVERGSPPSTSPSGPARSPPLTSTITVEVLDATAIERARHGRAGGRRPAAARWSRG